MSNSSKEVELGGELTASEGDIRELLRRAGPRPEVPAEDLAGINAAARAEWEKLVENQRRSRPVAWPGRAIAVAATLALALGASWWLVSRPPVSSAVAMVELVRGEVRLDDRTVAPGDVFPVGSEITTPGGAAAGALAIRLADGHSVRVDADSRVRLLSEQSLELIRGGVYVDSGHAGAPGSAIEIATVFGAVRDIGTQFEVRLENGGALSLRVRVREGSVVVSHGPEAHSAEAGEELTVRRDGAVERASVPRHGSDWAWAVAAAPAFEIEGLSLQGYLDWLRRETGLEIRFSDPALAESASDIQLFGSIEGFTPLESIDVVVPGSGLDYEVTGGEVLIRSRPVV